ncbi:MAG: VIT family protein [Herminiimonas sp.]|nr:VIT family protein [Herminiimonas sp.]
MKRRHLERHNIDKVGWLRAAVLGANDGIVSTASLLLGVASAHAAHNSIMLTGIAGLTAGAMSMATGEYVSVHSQSDTEKAAIAEERQELDADYHSEQNELAAIYVGRGLDLPLANQVAQKLMEHDALAAHTRDELGISTRTSARPLQAALASACSFAIGAILPLAVAAFAPEAQLIAWVAGAALVSLAILGGLAAKTGGARIWTGVMRVTFWSALAMGVTAGVGALFGVAT